MQLVGHLYIHTFARKNENNVTSVLVDRHCLALDCEIRVAVVVVLLGLEI